MLKYDERFIDFGCVKNTLKSNETLHLIIPDFLFKERRSTKRSHLLGSTRSECRLERIAGLR